MEFDRVVDLVAGLGGPDASHATAVQQVGHFPLVLVSDLFPETNPSTFLPE